MKVTVAVVFFVTCLCAPFLRIASLNTLFGLAVPYTVWTYLSAAWLNTVVYGAVSN